MGLVDPDSTTQDWDTMRTKVTNGKTMLSIWSWLGKPRMNSDENKAKGVGFMLAPLENMKVYSDGFQPDGDGATIVAIGSKAKNKARLAKFIDWMYSPEGIYALPPTPVAPPARRIWAASPPTRTARTRP